MRPFQEHLDEVRDSVAIAGEPVDEAGDALDRCDGAVPHTDAVSEGVRRRICEALRGKSVRTIASETGFCAETVRRYLRTSKCSVEFVATLCTRYGLSAEWLLFGRGSPQYSHQTKSALAHASIRSLLIELAHRWESLDAAADLADRHVGTHGEVTRR